jgi:hypothetical protein
MIITLLNGCFIKSKLSKHFFFLELFLPFIAFLFIALVFYCIKELLAVALVYLEKTALA